MVLKDPSPLDYVEHPCFSYYSIQEIRRLSRKYEVRQAENFLVASGVVYYPFFPSEKPGFKSLWFPVILFDFILFDFQVFFSRH